MVRQWGSLVRLRGEERKMERVVSGIGGKRIREKGGRSAAGRRWFTGGQCSPTMVDGDGGVMECDIYI